MEWNEIGKMLTNEVTKSERDNLSTKIVESNESYNSYKELSILLNRMNSMNKKINTDAAWEKFKTRIEVEEQSRKEKVIRLRKTIQYAASLVLLATLMVITYYFMPSNNLNTTVANDTKLYQPVILADGTEVSLNYNTKFEYPGEFEGSERNVHLNGEAFFNVSHNPEKPFIIDLDITKVEVLGTSFNIKHRGDGEIQVFVKTGKVKFFSTNNLKEQIILTPGEIGTFKNGVFTKQINENLNIISWKTNQFKFKATSLADVFETMEIVYNTEISTQNREIDSLKLTSNFTGESIENVMDVICSTFDLKATKEGRNYVLSKIN